MKIRENPTALDLEGTTNFKRIPKKTNIPLLLNEENYAALDQVIVSKPLGMSPSLFGDNAWDISPYIHNPDNDNKRKIDFSFLDEHKALQLEAKIICYGWIFHKSGRKTKPAKIQTIWNRFSNFKKVYKYLALHNYKSISEFRRNRIWKDFQDFIKKGEYSYSSLDEMFIAFNRVRDLETWLQIDFKLPRFKVKTIAKKLAASSDNQALAIPSRIVDIIYGKAIKIVEDCHPFLGKIAKVESLIQENFRAGQRVVDEKIALGILKFISEQGDEQYAQEVNRACPEKASSIIRSNLSEFNLLPKKFDGQWWTSFKSELVTACYICCAGFSGMRISEINKMMANSASSEVIEETQFNFIHSTEQKIHNGKKFAWVSAPISMKACEIITALTKHMRVELQQLNDKYKNRLWLTQQARTKPPIPISGWNSRLQLFAKKASATLNDKDIQECKVANPNSLKNLKKYVKLGAVWHLTTHQFRRTLAVFSASNRLSSPVAIKQQFKHLYLQMTDWYREGAKELREEGYMVDPEFNQLLIEEKNKFVTNKYFDWFNSDKKLSGSGGKAIMNLRGDAPKLYSDWNTLYKAIKSKKLSLHSSLHSHCRNGYNCDMEGVVNPAFCVDCNSDGSVIEDEHAKNWQQKHTRLTDFFDQNKDMTFQEKLPFLLQIQAAENVMKDFDIAFTKFPELIEVALS